MSEIKYYIIAALSFIIITSSIVFSAYAEGEFVNKFTLLSSDIVSNTQEYSSVLISGSKDALQTMVNAMSNVLFYKVEGFPLSVIWLVAGGFFFTFKLGFVNIRMFGHAISVLRGKYSSKNDKGEVTHFQALVAAVSATVGLGNIAGVAIAVSLGGPGAVIWMIIAGFFGMSVKFAEVTLGQRYRKIDKHGKVSGGAFHYLKDGLAEKNLPRLGKILAFLFAIFCIGGSLGGGNMFQSNQTVKLMTNSFHSLGGMDWAIALVLAVSVGIVLIGGIKRIAVVAEAVVPLMAFIYITASIVVIIVNSDKINAAIVFMFQDAFTGSAVGGGAIGAIINGFKRAVFSNEAGIGSAPIAHSAAKTNEPVREGCVALLEPFIDTVIICFITGIVITVTGAYEDNATGEISGIMLTSNAFATVIEWFPIVLSVAVALFAYSTMITWSYYGERSWEYLFGRKSIGVFHIIFCLAVFLGGVYEDISLVVDLSDLFVLSMAVPNMIGLYILSGKIKGELEVYTKKLKAGKFKVNA